MHATFFISVLSSKKLFALLWQTDRLCVFWRIFITHRESALWNLIFHPQHLRVFFRRRDCYIGESSPFKGMSSRSLCNGNLEQPTCAGDVSCRLVILFLDQLCPHPSYIRHGLSVSTSQLSALMALGDLAFQQPIMVTRTGTIIDGYARWELARRLGRQSIPCLEYDVDEKEALRWLILCHRPSKGFNGYCRSLLALDLEPSLRPKARANQQIGGQQKESSDLTEAQKLEL